MVPTQGKVQNGVAAQGGGTSVEPEEPEAAPSLVGVEEAAVVDRGVLEVLAEQVDHLVAGEVERQG